MKTMYEPTTNEWAVYVAEPWKARPVYHSLDGSNSFRDRTSCGVTVHPWSVYIYRLLDPERVRPCRRCFR